MSVLSSTGAFLEGYNAPKKGMDPELYHSLVQDYLALLSQMEVEEIRLKTQAVTSYATMASSLMSAQANILGALAEEAKAHGMPSQAKASVMSEIYKPLADLTADVIMSQAPAGSMEAVQGSLDLAANKTLESFSRSGAQAMSEAIDGGNVGDKTDYGLVEALLGKHLTDSSYKQIINTAGATINTDGQAWTAVQTVSYATGVVQQNEKQATQLISAKAQANPYWRLAMKKYPEWGCRIQRTEMTSS